MKVSLKRLVGMAGVVLLASCRSEFDSPLFQSSTLCNQSAFCISMDARLWHFVTPSDAADTAALPMSERAMGTPVGESWRIEYAVDANGLASGFLERKSDASLPVYPEGSMGLVSDIQRDPVARIELQGGEMRWFDASGTELAVGTQSDGEVQWWLSFLDQLRPQTFVSEGVFGALLEGLDDLGLTVTHVNERYAVMKQVTGYGYNNWIIDKELQVVSGMDAYDADGQLDHSQRTFYDAAGKPLVHWFRAFYDSPLTGKRMVLHRVAELSNVYVEF